MKLITKGQWYHEVQILMLVIMWKHDNTHKANSGFRLGRLVIWRDTAWLSHGFGLKYPSVSLRMELIYCKIERAYWCLMVKKIDLQIFLISFKNYLQLYKAGFRISNSRSDKDPDYEFYLFFWNNKVIKDMADIERVGDRYNTILNGHSERLE